MKKYIQYSVATGEITQIFDCSENDSIEHLSGDGYEIIESNGDYSDGYVQNGEPFHFPAKPSPHHEWDWPTKSWLPNLDGAKAAKKRDIDALRSAMIDAPLDYDGKSLDADQSARDNLKAKLEEVRERIRLGIPMLSELLVWRDADNVTHSWPTIEAYHDWLAGFAVAMSERGTRCYACGWHHKDAIGEQNDPNGQPWTVESVQGYELTGWPE